VPKHLLLPIFLFAATLLAQAPRVEYFTVTDGLSAREINDLHIGNDGFLWVATMDGLNRFDGQTFRRFGERSASQPGLSRGAIAGVRPDNEGKFIVTFQDFFGYFDRFDPQDFKVEQVRLAPSTGVLGYPRAITTDTLGRTFVVSIGTEGTFLYEYTPNNSRSRTFTPIYHELTDAWTTLTPRVELLALSNGQFLLYDAEHGFRHLSATGKLLSRPFEDDTDLRRFYAFAEAADGRVFLSFRESIELFSWSPETRDYVPVNTQNSKLRFPTMYRDQLGQLLLPGTEDILGEQAPVEYYLVDMAGQLDYLEADLPTGRPLSAMAAVDFRETVYLGLREGLGVVERYRNYVATYLTENPNGRLFPHRMVALAEDRNGHVYALEEDGVVYVSTPGKTGLDTLVLTAAADGTQRINFRAATDLLYDPAKHQLWGSARPAGRQKGGLLFCYDISQATTRSYSLAYPPQAMARGADGTLYLGVSDPRQVGLLMRFDAADGSCLPLEDGLTPGAAIGGFRINDLYVTTRGEVLIGTANRGLLGYDPATNKLREINLTVNKSAEEKAGAAAGAGKVVEAVFAIREDRPGHYWLGTDGGLLHYDRQAGTTEQFGRAEGLSSNLVYGILPDSANGFWLSTQNGLTHLLADRAFGSVRRYYREDGLSNDEFLPGSALKGADGRYYFGGISGLTTFREKDLAGSSTGADVMLTQIDIYGRNENRTITRNLGKLFQVTVLAREKSIAISFALPAGQLPSSSQFRYKLEGFNDDWVPLVNERTIRFNNLASGNYVLRIQGAGANGNYGGGERRLTIQVRQYVVEMLWFQVLVVVAFAGLLFFILQAKLREKLRNEKLRTQLSADIHDEVSGLLAGITLQAELLKNRTEDEKLQARLHTVGEAGRSAMSKMSDVIWSIDSRRDTIGNLLQRMQEHADEVLLPIDIRYDFRSSGFDNMDKELPGNIRQDVYFIYKEAINNIARHSNATRVEIEVEQFAQFFELFIRDNGKPVTADPATSNSLGTRVRAQKTGQGKDNMRMRAKRLKGDLSVDDREGYTLTFRMRRLG